MRITEIYQKYRIMPSLQTHMLRVAGVAQVIYENLKGSVPPINVSLVLQACLLHDMGNIVKSDLTRFPDFVQPEGLEYWQQVQNEFFAQYGFGEHHVTKQIVQEIGASPQLLQLIEAIGFDHAKANYELPSYERKICAYADMRVAPHGVTSLKERLADLKVRYEKEYAGITQEQRRVEFADYLYKIEQQIFEHSHISPEFITEEVVQETFLQLEETEVP